ncbi:MAG: preprotein translocase subunit SecY [Deltaproteobacteria bacterium]|nr:preprotein translocase subunit SecY [Deltaproteobacteria bacterium]
MIGGVQNIGRVPELQRRILFTFGMLAVYRLGAHIVTPGINPEVIRNFFDQMGGTMFGLFNLFSGGALEQLSIFALGIMPYISASIIFQLLTVVIPQVEQLQKEGEQGRRKITQWTRYATVVIALLQSLLLAFALENGQFGENAVIAPGWGFRILMMLTLTTGTAFIMWLGEQITERGIGNGISLIIFAGIVVSIPSALTSLVELIRTDQFTLLGALLLLAFTVLVTGFVVYCERGQRRIPIQHAKRVVGRRVMQGGMSYFPLRLNTAGVIPPIFASSILMFPLTITQFVESETVSNFFTDYLGFGSPLYNLIYIGLIVFFAFFYTAIVINPNDVADNIKRSGAYIPGIRPGKKTAEYIDRILGRLTLIGALYVAAVCILPVLLSNQVGVPFYFGGTALLIVVGVALDTVGQIEAHLVSRQYEGFVKGTRIRGRLGR